MVLIKENESLIKHLKITGYLKSKQLEDAMRKFPSHLFVPLVGEKGFKNF
jgi:hypothetical protein